MYYYVPEENLETERNDPSSTYRLPSYEGSYNNNNPPPIYLWNQAVFIIAQLLTAGLLHINELDPIRRYLPSYNRPRRAGRYSAFQVRFFYNSSSLQYFLTFLNVFIFIETGKTDYRE